MNYRKVIAIDFDGTLCKSEYPVILKPKKRVIKRAIKEQERGALLILWTCREGRELAEAIKWCRSHGLIFDAINSNPTEQIRTFGTDPRKIGADEYWDDKSRRIIF